MENLLDATLTSFACLNLKLCWFGTQFDKFKIDDAEEDYSDVEDSQN